VRTFWKSRFAKGASYFGSAVVRERVVSVTHALKQSAQTAAPRRRKKLRLRNRVVINSYSQPHARVFLARQETFDNYMAVTPIGPNTRQQNK
jgi:hypothetical protein